VYETYNKQFTKTAVDIAEQNVTALLHELRTGERYARPAKGKGGPEATRSARGPTTMADVAESAAAGAAAAEAAGAAPKEGAVAPPAPEAPEAAADAAPADAAAEAGDPDAELPGAGASAADGKPPAEDDAAAFDMSALDDALRAAEAALDDAAWARLVGRFTLVPVLGDLSKVLTSKARWHGAFDAAALGHRHVHLAGPEHGLARAVRAGGALAVEGVKYMLQLRPEQAAAFGGKVVGIASPAGWRLRPPPADAQLALRDAQLLFTNGAIAGVASSDGTAAGDAGAEAAAKAAAEVAAAAAAAVAAEDESDPC